MIGTIKAQDWPAGLPLLTPLIGRRLGLETPMTEALGAFARRAAALRDRVTTV